MLLLLSKLLRLKLELNHNLMLRYYTKAMNILAATRSNTKSNRLFSDLYEKMKQVLILEQVSSDRFSSEEKNSRFQHRRMTEDSGCALRFTLLRKILIQNFLPHSIQPTSNSNVEYFWTLAFLKTLNTKTTTSPSRDVLEFCIGSPPVANHSLFRKCPIKWLF